MPSLTDSHPPQGSIDSSCKSSGIVKIIVAEGSVKMPRHKLAGRLGSGPSARSFQYDGSAAEPVIVLL